MAAEEDYQSAIGNATLKLIVTCIVIGLLLGLAAGLGLAAILS